MMISLIVFLVMVIGVNVSAESCEFCPGNAQPGTPDDTILGSFTCSFYATIAPNVDSTDSECQEFENFRYVCECPGLSNGTCVGICPDGSEVGRPDAQLLEGGVSLGLTCSQYDKIAKGQSDDTKCSEIQTNFAGYCSCPNVTDTCSGICTAGQTLTNPDVIVPVGTQVWTCKQYDFALQFVPADSQCETAQARLGYICGCLDSSTPSTATESPQFTNAPITTPVVEPDTFVPIEPLTLEPVSFAPVTLAPVTLAPVLEPATESPISSTPVSSAPITDAPIVTTAPIATTAPIVTTAPVSTVAPISTDAPVSVTTEPITLTPVVVTDEPVLSTSPTLMPSMDITMPEPIATEPPSASPSQLSTVATTNNRIPLSAFTSSAFGYRMTAVVTVATVSLFAMI